MYGQKNVRVNSCVAFWNLFAKGLFSMISSGMATVVGAIDISGNKIMTGSKPDLTTFGFMIRCPNSEFSEPWQKMSNGDGEKKTTVKPRG